MHQHRTVTIEAPHLAVGFCSSDTECNRARMPHSPDGQEIRGSVGSASLPQLEELSTQHARRRDDEGIIGNYSEEGGNCLLPTRKS